MCFGSDSKSVSTSSIPDWMSSGVQKNLSTLDTLASRPYPKPTFPRIAEFSPDTTASFDLTRGNVGSYGPAYDKALSTAGEFADLTWPGADVNAYMNPYVQQVLDRGVEQLRRSGQVDRAAITRNMAASGGQDGGRHGVVEAQSYNDQNTNIANFIASQLMNAYGAATNQFNADRTGRLAATAALGNLGTAKSNMGYRDAAAVAGIGGVQENKTQQNLDLASQDYYGEFGYPLDMLQLRQSLLTGSPYSTTTTTKGPSGSGAGTAIGAGVSLAGLLASMGGSGSAGGFDISNLWPF